MRTQSKDIALSASVFDIFWQSGSSTSPSASEASSSFQIVTEVMNREEGLSALSQRRKELVDKVRAAYNQARNDNWGGENEKAVTEETYSQAVSFADTLPKDCPQPDVVAFPDGTIVFEWENTDGAVLSASLKDDKKLAYAMYAGENNREHALRSFHGFGVPDFEKILRKYFY